jgi:cupin fold WbuC family metalloprotein
MVIKKEVLDELTEHAKANPRLRQAMDLRNSSEDGSQRMLNALEPGTVMPIHRHHGSSETCVCIRGHFEEYLYGFKELRSDGTPDPDSFGIVETIDMYPGGPVLNIEKDQWHNLCCLESGTILLEAKDGPYHPLEEDEIMEV